MSLYLQTHLDLLCLGQVSFQFPGKSALAEVYTSAFVIVEVLPGWSLSETAIVANSAQNPSSYTVLTSYCLTSLGWEFGGLPSETANHQNPIQGWLCPVGHHVKKGVVLGSEPLS